MTKSQHILVLTEIYPSDEDNYSAVFIHNRLKEYQALGCKLTVLSFQASLPYSYQGVSVIPRGGLKADQNFDVVVCHAPNVRNQLLFLLSHSKKFKNIIFVLHGHEVIQKSRYYPKLYAFNNTIVKRLKSIVFDAYDYVKRLLMHCYVRKYLGKKLRIIFVSDWMKDAFVDNIKISEVRLENVSSVISNPVGNAFVENNFDFNGDKDADFITIRPFDSPIKAIDVVVKVAKENPDFSFHIYGKGEYFKHNDVPGNVKVFNRFINNDDIPALLNKYHVALLPTRLDSQGVMMCEIATFGMPIVVSDIPVCHSMMKEFYNVAYLDNDNPIFDARKFLDSVNPTAKTNKQKFNLDNTVRKEIAFVLANSPIRDAVNV